jgi:hypothetical protein
MDEYRYVKLATEIHNRMFCRPLIEAEESACQKYGTTAENLLRFAERYGFCQSERYVLLTACGMGEREATSILRVLRDDLSPDRFKRAAGFRIKLIEETKAMWQKLLFDFLSQRSTGEFIRWTVEEQQKFISDLLDDWIANPF